VTSGTVLTTHRQQAGKTGEPNGWRRAESDALTTARLKQAARDFREQAEELAASLS